MWYNYSSTNHINSHGATVIARGLRQPLGRLSMSNHTISSDYPQHRFCSKCFQLKPITDFPIKRSQRNDSVWYRGECKLCHRDYKNAQRRKAAQERTHTTPEFKTCVGCNVTKPISAFGIGRREADGVQPYCKNCRKAYRYANKGREVQRVIEWQRRNPERHYQKQLLWDKRNIERVREIGRLAENRRRTRKTQAGGSFTAEEWDALCVRHDHRCVACGEQKKLTADHIMPVSKGGSSNIENIQPLCQSCNSRKGDKVIDYRARWETQDAE